MIILIINEMKKVMIICNEMKKLIMMMMKSNDINEMTIN